MNGPVSRKRRAFLHYAGIGAFTAAFSPRLLFAEGDRLTNRPS